jgi:hypothetical protein
MSRVTEEVERLRAMSSYRASVDRQYQEDEEADEGDEEADEEEEQPGDDCCPMDEVQEMLALSRGPLMVVHEADESGFEAATPPTCTIHTVQIHHPAEPAPSEIAPSETSAGPRSIKSELARMRAKLRAKGLSCKGKLEELTARLAAADGQTDHVAEHETEEDGPGEEEPVPWGLPE